MENRLEWARIQMKTYLFSYPYKGGRYGLELPADSLEEARGRVEAIRHAKYDGELEMKIPAVTGSLLPRLITWWKNL